MTEWEAIEICERLDVLEGHHARMDSRLEQLAEGLVRDVQDRLADILKLVEDMRNVKSVQDCVHTRSLRIVNEAGKTCAQITADPAGCGLIEIRDEAGNCLAGMIIEDDRGRMFVGDRTGKHCILSVGGAHAKAES